MKRTYPLSLLAAPVALALAIACRGEDSVSDAGSGGSKPSHPGGEGGEPAASGGASASGGAHQALGGEGMTLDCADGVALVMTDYISTEIALFNLDGTLNDASLISSASTITDGLAFPLSGDIMVPSGNFADVVVLDRYGTNVISWVNPKNGQVRTQLPVGTGFESNPQDYLELDDGEAVIVRYGQNGDPGQVDFDTGGDLLFLDIETPKITGEIVFESEGDLPPRPTNLSLLGSDLFVTLDRLSLDYAEMGDARLVPVSLHDKAAGEAIALKGLKSCGELVPVPGKREVAIACAGRVDSTGVIEALSQSAVVFFDADERPLREVRRISASSIAGEAIQSRVAFANSEVMLVRTQTPWGGDTHNRLIAYNLNTEKAEELLQATPDAISGKGRGASFGSVYCAPGCSKVCLMPDSSRGELVLIEVKDGSARVKSAEPIEGSAGLPPSSLGSY